MIKQWCRAMSVLSLVDLKLETVSMTEMQPLAKHQALSQASIQPNDKLHFTHPKLLLEQTGMGLQSLAVGLGRSLVTWQL
jgi:hypothetical protein